MIQAIASFLGYIIRFFYDIVGNNYLITILIFTFFTKIVLFPLTFGQIKSMEKKKKFKINIKMIKKNKLKNYLICIKKIKLILYLDVYH